MVCCWRCSWYVSVRFFAEAQHSLVGSGRPAELYRTDFITAMKVNETDTSLDKEDWWVVSDPWRQDWNKGVQIPVDIASIPHAECRLAPAQMRVVLSSTNKQ
jgi:protein Jade-1